MATTGYGIGKAYAVEPEYRTQKARGLKALSDNGFLTPDFEVFGIEHFTNPIEPTGQICMFTNPEHLQNLVGRFVRPCPMVPRHGFVDSRPISSTEDAQRIIDETLAVEDRAELITMPFIKAEYSAIWTNGQLVVGPSNDGATSGKGSRVIPALGQPCWNPQTWKLTKEQAHVTEAPYVELLWSKPYSYSTDYKTMFVQLRNGPELPSNIDYIPEAMTVKHVVVADGDLLEWESKVKTLEPGTVVYHPEGSLASHYAVHAVLNKIPVLISREPVVGETLKPNSENTSANPARIKAGFVLGATAELNYQQAAYAMLVGCHSTGVWLGKADVLLGFALGCAYRLIITAALGEMRHQPGRSRRPSRNAVYDGVWRKMLKPATRTRYMRALHSFEHDNWVGAYGGAKWLEFSKFAGAIYNSVLDEDVTKALEYLNHAVHAAHNSGWAFDKFLKQATLDETALNPSITLLKCAPALYRAIVEAEQNPNLSDWFKKKHHIEQEPLEIDRASKADATDEETESEPACECGECDCSQCNPDGENNCGSHSCETCYPDGCPFGPHDCSDCYPDGCEDSECETCNPNAEQKSVMEAQATLTTGQTSSVLHIQYKTKQQLENPKSKKDYKTKDIMLTGASIARVKDMLDKAEKQASYNGSGKSYSLFKVLPGYEQTTSGKMFYLGNPDEIHARYLVIL